jgi:hypothetical protein
MYDTSQKLSLLRFDFHCTPCYYDGLNQYCSWLEQHRGLLHTLLWNVTVPCLWCTLRKLQILSSSHEWNEKKNFLERWPSVLFVFSLFTLSITETVVSRDMWTDKQISKRQARKETEAKFYTVTSAPTFLHESKNYVRGNNNPSRGNEIFKSSNECMN